jgi:hypothetical protein
MDDRIWRKIDETTSRMRSRLFIDLDSLELTTKAPVLVIADWCSQENETARQDGPP